MLARRNECSPRWPSPAARRNDISSYRKLSGQPRTHARPHTPAGELGAYSALAFAAFLAFDQTVRQHLGDPSDVAATVRPKFQVRRKAAGGHASLCSLPDADFGLAWGHFSRGTYVLNSAHHVDNRRSLPRAKQDPCHNFHTVLYASSAMASVRCLISLPVQTVACWISVSNL